MAQPLSTTTMNRLMNDGKVLEVVDMVNGHISKNPTDSTSAGKVLSTVATFAYKNPIPMEVCDGLMKSLCSCSAILAKSKTNIKENYASLYHVMAQLAKQELLESVTLLAPAFFNLSDALEVPGAVKSQAYVLYGLLWNLGTKATPKDESGQKVMVEVTFLSLKFLLCAKDYEKFTLGKVGERLRFFLRLILSKKTLPDSVTGALFTESLSLLSSQVLLGLPRFELWLHLLELDSRHCQGSHQSLLQSAADNLFPDEQFDKELGLVKTLLAICRGGKNGIDSNGRLAGQELSPSCPSLPFLATMMEALVSSTASSLPTNKSLPDLSIIAIIFTLDQRTSSTFKLLTSLLTALLTALKSLPQTQLSVDQPLVASSQQLLARLHASIFNYTSNGGHAVDSGHLANLASHSYTLAALLYQAKIYPPCADLLSSSLSACIALSTRDPSRKGLARPRYKLQAEVMSKLGKHKEALVSLAKGLVIASQVEEASRLARLQEGGKSWCQIKREWQKACGESAVNDTYILALAEDGGLGKEEELPKEVILRLGRAEITWHRAPYTPGGSLTESWVGSAAALAKFSKDPIDHGMVLLEQTLVFWVGDNHDDLKTGSRCAEKAASLLAGDGQNLGWALFLRFLCEHRTMMVQITKEVEKAEQLKVLERKEKEGLGGPQDAQETEVTPAFGGLTVEVQEKLQGFLEKALQAWSRVDLEPTDWMSCKSICDMLLALAWHQRRFGMGAREAFQLAAIVASQMSELEHEVLALAELVKLGQSEWIEKMLKAAETLEKSKTGTASGLQTAIAMVEVLLDRGEVEDARKVIEEMLRDASVRSNSLRFYLIQAELRLLASKMRMREREWVDHHSVKGTSKTKLSQAGPIDLALDAWKLAATASKWAETDLRTPSSQELGLLWIVPMLGDLQLRCVDQISSLFRSIGAPRELKCHLKWGLRLSQTLCLPLRSAHFLLKLSDCYLLCDDEVAAEALLQGVDHILGGKMAKGRAGERGTAGSQVEEMVKLPGQSELQALTASPSLVRPVVSKPEFLTHPSSCSCFCCNTPALHVVLLKLAFYRAAARDMAGDGGSALSMVDQALEMVPCLVSQTNDVSESKSGVLEHLRVEYVGGLQGRVESLGCRHAWEECKHIMNLINQELSALPFNKVKALPELVLRAKEQERFLLAAERRGKELEAERMEKDQQSLLVSNLSNLKLEVDQSRTPEPASRTSSRVVNGAPSKRVGDSSGIAKDLEKLGLVSEQSPNPMTDSKQVREGKKKAAANPRISCLDQLGELNLKRVVPKLTLTEGTPTPKKFFKTVTPLMLATPTLKAVGAAGKTAGSRSKASKPDPRSPPTSKKKQFKSPISAKENAGFGIYEDEEDSAPVQALTEEQTPATGRGSRSSARRKENLTASSSKTVAPSSSTKLPRMAPLPEVEAVGRQSSRRKAALKRL